MTMSTMIVSTVLVLFAAILHQTSGCSCVGNIKFCDSDFAIRGTILDIEGNATAYEDLIYSVQVEKVHRNTSDGIAVGAIIDIETPGSTCGVDLLMNGSTYLISGLYDTSYSMDRCNSVVVNYDEYYDVDDLGIPCSASLTTITSYVVIVCALLHLILR